MKTQNAFSTARSQFKTIGEVIDALIESFSTPGSADTMGEYMLERALDEVKKRRPERQAEWDEVMARLDKTFQPPVTEVTQNKNYTETVEAGHTVESYMRKCGVQKDSAYSKMWTLTSGVNVYTMEITANSNVPRYMLNGRAIMASSVYAALIQI